MCLCSMIYMAVVFRLYENMYYITVVTCMKDVSVTISNFLHQWSNNVTNVYMPCVKYLAKLPTSAMPTNLI